MSQHYNKKRWKQRRRRLRQDQPEAEELVWEMLRNRKCLGIKFRRQYSVDYYILNFYAPALQLAVEVDGGIHHSGAQQEYDQTRTDYIESFGIAILRLPNELVVNAPEKTVKRIKTVIRKLQTNRK